MRSKRTMEAWFEGENPLKFDRILMYGGSTIGAVLIILSAPDLNAIQYIGLFLIAWDLLGGVVSNFSKSTSEFYAKQTLRKKFLFLSVHFIHPLVLILLFDLSWTFMQIYLFMLLGSWSLQYVKRQSRDSYAAFLTILICIIIFILEPMPTYLLWFVPTYMVKLLLSMSSKL